MVAARLLFSGKKSFAMVASGGRHFCSRGNIHFFSNIFHKKGELFAFLNFYLRMRCLGEKGRNAHTKNNTLTWLGSLHTHTLLREAWAFVL